VTGEHCHSERSEESPAPPRETLRCAQGDDGDRRPHGNRFALLARYVFGVDSPPIADGVVVIEGERIAAVGRAPAISSSDEIIDLGNAAILPGLVNAHTHLEFSDLQRPLGQPDMAFPDWIRTVVAHRRNVGDSLRESHQLAERVDHSAAGLSESLRGGVTTLGEIATAAWSAEPFSRSPLASTVFLELIGLRRELIEDRLASAKRHLLSASANAGQTWRAGISPHAPYSVHPELFARCIELARQAGAPLAFHLAESREELELLQGGAGPFRELLTELGAWDPSAIPHGTRPLDYLKPLAHAPRALVIHGNYLVDDEIAVLTEHAATMSLVYCPRTHAYFGNDPYPLARLLDAGVTVALGTDSRASNPDLSLLAEMRHVAASGKISLATVLRLGTLNGAKALGLDHDIGSISVGKQADLCVVKLPEGDAADPHEALMFGGGDVFSVMRLGRIVYANPLASRPPLGMI
jgi:cytosine/adenosine deaminase-related metal-dependent hydrolase